MNSLKKNYIYSLLYQVLILFLPLITTPYLSRVLGAEAIGQYSYSYSIAYYFTIFGILGLNNYGNRTIAHVRDDKKELSKCFINIYCMQLITCAIVLIIYVFYALNNNFLALIQIITVISALFDINWFFFGIENFKFTVTRNVIIKLTGFFLTILLVKETNDVWIYCLIMSFTFLLSNLCLFPFLKRYITLEKPELQEIIKHFKPNFLLFIPVLSVSLYKVMDKIMLGTLTNDLSEVGYYENSERVLSLPLALITSLGTVMLPRISNLASNHDNDTTNKYFRNSILLILFLSSSTVFGLLSILNEFVSIFFGSGFEKCELILYILLPSTLFIGFANVIRTQYLIPFKKDEIYIKSVILGAIVNLTVNWILIPKYLSVGAAIGTLLAEAIVCIYQAYRVRKEIPTLNYFIEGLPFIVIGMIMWIVLYYIHVESLLIQMIIRIVIGSIIYLFLAYLYVKYKKKMNGN